MTQKIIILLGPPGSGKGTQAVRISKNLGIPHISTGDLFRQHLKNNTDLGKKVRSYMDSGKLVPDTLVLDMLFDRVSKSDCRSGYLLDGFPRTLAQAEALEKHLNKSSTITAINLNVNDDTLVKRISGRLTCKACGHVHNTFFSPPSKTNKCDKCQGDLFHRDDDEASIVEERLRVYHQQTAPLIKFYKDKSVLTDINGEDPADTVFNNISKVLKKRG